MILDVILERVRKVALACETWVRSNIRTLAPELVESTYLRVRVERGEDGRDIVLRPESFRLKKVYRLRLHRKASGRPLEVSLPARVCAHVERLFEGIESRRLATRLEYARDGELQLLVTGRRETTVTAEELWAAFGFAPTARGSLSAPSLTSA